MFLPVRFFILKEWEWEIEYHFFLASVIAILKNEKCYGKTWKARACLDSTIRILDLSCCRLVPAQLAPLGNCGKQAKDNKNSHGGHITKEPVEIREFLTIHECGNSLI